MIVSLREGADAGAVKRALVARGQWVRSEEGGARYFVLEPHSARVRSEELLAIEGVASVSAEPSAHPRFDAQAGQAVEVAGVRFAPPSAGAAGARAVLIAGPCAIESEAQVHSVARAVAKSGARVLRGGAFKPRSSPYAFQGHGEPALKWMRSAADANGLAVVTEVLAEQEVGLVAEHADMLQVGSRNMQNFALLKAVGAAKKPVLLKRGVAATMQEWLLAGEYLLVNGARGVLLCERGVRGFDPSTRNLLDLGAVAQLAHAHGLAVVADPSHGTGRRDLVVPLARAALAAGAAGVMIEVHDEPGRALSDGPQALLPDELARAVEAGMLGGGAR